MEVQCWDEVQFRQRHSHQQRRRRHEFMSDGIRQTAGSIILGLRLPHLTCLPHLEALTDLATSLTVTSQRITARCFISRPGWPTSLSSPTPRHRTSRGVERQLLRHQHRVRTIGILTIHPFLRRHRQYGERRQPSITICRMLFLTTSHINNTTTVHPQHQPA